MTVPTHNLYDFVHQLTKKQYWLRYFSPWGSKDLYDAIPYLNSDIENSSNLYPDSIFYKKNLPGKVLDYVPILFCHDQEPLHFDLYSDENISQRMWEKRLNSNKDQDIFNLNLRLSQPGDWHQYWILLHSELNSPELDKYTNTNRYKGAYWWSHALISLDWYRFAEHDARLYTSNKSQKKFLIYARDTNGSRKYRADFLNLIKNSDINDQCQIGSFILQDAKPEYSAIYDYNDFNKTDISVVLETVFDTRIHLTEKTLRPIACGHPFILAGGPGSLKLLNNYGFETFHPFIDESYDQEIDAGKRLKMIAQEMHRLSSLEDSKYYKILEKCNSIAKKNKKRFFSKDFFEFVVNELVTNVEIARQDVLHNMDWKYLLKRRNQRKVSNVAKWKLRSRKDRALTALLIRHLRQGGTIKDYEPPFEN